MNQKPKKKNILISLNSPLTENIFSRIGVKYLKKHFHIVLLDFIDLFSEDFYKNNKIQNPSDIDIEVIRIKKISDFDEVFKNKNPIFLMDCIGRSGKTLIIQNACNKNKITYIFHSLLNSPSKSRFKNILNRVLSKLPGKVCGFFAYTFCRILYLREGYRRPDMILTSSSIGSLWEMSSKKRIFSSSNLYFEYLQNQKTLETDFNKNDDFILYLDDCLFDSFDYQLGYKKLEYSKKSYFKCLDLFFSEIEKKFNMPVIIAAHPNGHSIENYEKQFINRRVFFNNTCSLTKHSYFTMTHFSLSFTYAVLFQKPIYFIATDFIGKNNEKFQKEYSYSIGAQIVDIKRPEELDNNLLTVNEKLYKKYSNEYICSNPSYSNPYQEIINEFS